MEILLSILIKIVWQTVLKSRRIAQREVNPESVIFTCKKLKVKTEIYMGGKKILKILEDK